jgi:WhiB family transcriptional regulator, redox-sensing transcriptional regulator
VSEGLKSNQGDGAVRWQNRAACRGVEVEIFFPPDRDPIETVAKEICRACTVREDCLEYCLSHREEHGIWGGMTERERRHMRKYPDQY